jgi:preprotein translocase subunit SecD
LWRFGLLFRQANIKPGIDLAGGTSLIYEIDTTGIKPADQKELSERMINILRRRVDPANIQNLVWRPQGDTRFEIQMPLTSAEAQFCGRILSDLGADVIRVERPGGDPCRNTGPFYRDEVHPEKSLWWFVLNGNKRGITLDLEKQDGREDEDDRQLLGATRTRNRESAELTPIATPICRSAARRTKWKTFAPSPG